MKTALWHTKKINSVIKDLQTSPDGLTAKEASSRLQKYGSNKLPEEKSLPRLIIFLNQFKSPLVYVLIGAALITLFLQDYKDMAIILLAIFINATLGYYQESKANNAVTYLRKLVDYKARVLRDKNEIKINATDLVVGDIIILEAGDKITTDARIIKSDSFEVNEMSLTGESVPAKKNTEVYAKGEIISDRKNMVYAGTVVTRGRCSAVVCATGLQTEIGKITSLVKETEEEKTPLQLQLSKFSRSLTYVVLSVCVLVLIIGVSQGRPFIVFGEDATDSMLTTAAAIAVATIPEGLLIAITAVLAIGMQSILKQKALVRKLIAAETLGSVSVICTDKTGTLTEGKMRITQLLTFGAEINVGSGHKYQQSDKLQDHDLLLKTAVLCSDAVIENPDEDLQQWRFLGDTTEIGLMLGAIQAGLPYQEIKKNQARLEEIPFDSELKYMATLNQLSESQNVLYIKGAPEKILAMCSKLRSKGEKQKLTAEKLKAIEKQYEKLTSQGLRVLAFAYKKIPANKEVKLEDELNDLIFIGLISLRDPLRPEAKNTIRLAKKAGIHSVIITGDHRLTAKAIAAELGIKISENSILEGSDLEKMSDEELEKIIRKVVIYARVEPKHKLRIVNAWQKKGEVVAMTGDGVNDAPALKAADIGIALGSGTDVAKETSDIILLDDNFKTIVTAIERGRIIFSNIQKIIVYLLSGSFTAMILVAGSMIFGLPLALLPAQIIWNNFASTIPDLALVFEEKEDGLMSESPRVKNSPLLNSQMKTLIFIISIVTDIILLALFYLLLELSVYDLEHIRTIIFAAISLDSMLFVFSCRSLRKPIFKQNPFSNKFLIAGVAIGTGSLVLAVYQPQLQNMLQTVALEPSSWILVVCLSLVKLVAIEITKYYFIVKKNIKESYA
jgi:Ca2+-transporting ATPase